MYHSDRFSHQNSGIVVF